MRTDSKSKNSRGAKRSSGGSGSSSSVKRIYASQTVAKIADKSISKVLDEGAKKKPAAAKWLDKAKLSVLRKVNHTSKIIYTRNNTTESLLKEQGALLNSVRSKETILKALIMEKTKRNPLGKAIKQIIPESTYTSEALQKESQVISESYKSIQAKLKDTLNKTQKKIQALSNVIASASEEFASFKQNNAASSSSSGDGRGGGIVNDKGWDRVLNIAGEDVSDPIDDLLNHLSNS